MIEKAAKAMGKDPQISKQMQGEIDIYISTAMNVMYNDETNPELVALLKSSPPETSVPHAVNQISDMIDGAIKKDGRKVDPSVKMAGMMYITSDLIELGNASKAFDKPLTMEKDFQPLLQSSLQKVIYAGLRDGSIDPVELQAQTEPLLNEQQTAVGFEAAKSLGLPPSPTAEMGIDMTIQNKTRPLEQENKRLKGLLSKRAQQGERVQ